MWPEQVPDVLTFLTYDLMLSSSFVHQPVELFSESGLLSIEVYMMWIFVEWGANMMPH